MTRGPVLVGVAVLAALVSSCGAPEAPAATRVRHFYAAVGAGDAAGACADLSDDARKALEQQEQGRCAEVISDLDLPRIGTLDQVQVYGSMAEVRAGAESVFLSRFADGWRIVAAGCAPTSGDLPHECLLEG